MKEQGLTHIAAQESPYKVLVVDDERLARTLLEDYVSKMPMLRLVCSCANAMNAMAVLQQEKIDILLTDIEMPEMTGVEFVENLPYKPSVIFTTAYSQYAIDSYDLGVVDYLLKPISFNRFVKAVNKAVERLRLLRASENIPREHVQFQNQPPVEFQSQLNPPVQPQPQAEQADYMMVRADRRLYRVNFSDLIYVEGQQEYVTFHTKQRNITAFYSLKSLEELLPGKKFVRIHKSYIVSLAYLEIVEAANVTVAGVELPIGPSYRESVMKALKVEG